MNAKRHCIILIIAAVSATALPSSAAPEKTITMAEAKTFAIFAPRPGYPLEARRNKITGGGLVLLHVDASGRVTSVKMAQSTDSPILDHAAISAFKRWKFMPGGSYYVRTPITFTINGSSF